MTAPILNFGCRLNIAEGEAMARLAGDHGLAGAVIVNSCAVTASAEREARQAVRRAARTHPGRPIIVTGCAAQLRPALFAALPGVAAVLPNADKLAPGAWSALRRRIDPAPMPAEPASAPPERRHTRGFLQVQQGCDHRCTFCVIPLARGPSRSLPVEAVLQSAASLVAAGHHELVLTGVDLTAWGLDLAGGQRLGDLVAALLAHLPDLPRLRLSSVDPAELDARLWQLFADEQRLMPHLHLSVQAGDDLVLKQMKRRHLRADVIAVAERARALRPDAVLGADLIAGFPTESEAQFAHTLTLVETAGLDLLHVFPYSPRPGTPAARLTALPAAIVAERAARLRALGQARLGQRLDRLVGSEQTVLMERGRVGRTACFAPVALDAPPGGLVRCRIVGRAGDRLIGTAL